MTEALTQRPQRPHDLSAAHLVLSQYSLPKSSSFEEKVSAAAAAGFDALGMSVRDAVVLDPSFVVERLDEHDIVLSELEGLGGWAASGPARDQFVELEAAAHAMADATGARHVQVWGSYEGDLVEAATAFAGVCDRAAEHGLLVALEFLPFTNIPDAATALEIVERADRPNGGLCVDVWHHERGSRSVTQLLAIPAERVVGVQLDDGSQIPEDEDYYEDCIRNRRAPGQGEFALVEFLQALRAVGSRAPLAIEVLSDTTQTRSAVEVAEELLIAARDVRTAAWEHDR